jgi:hypothetical protein
MQFRRIILASAIVATFALRVTPPVAAGGLVDQSIDALFNLRDQLQGVVMKSVKGVADAMQDGPAPEGPGESTIAYFSRKQQQYQQRYKQQPESRASSAELADDRPATSDEIAEGRSEASASRARHQDHQ